VAVREHYRCQSTSGKPGPSQQGMNYGDSDIPDTSCEPGNYSPLCLAFSSKNGSSLQLNGDIWSPSAS
jgi:hypothetical protein